MLCQVCRSETTASKPFCIDHLDHLPYVQFLRAYVEVREFEAENASTGVNLNGLLAAEILELLNRRAPMAVPAVAKTLDLSPDVVEHYMAKLVEAKYLELDGVVIHLTEAGKSHGSALQRFIS